MNSTGTRTRATTLTRRPDQGSETRTHSADAGLAKNVTASCTFVASPTKQIQAANGTFTPFAVGDEVLVSKTNLNNGVFTVTAIDGTNHAYLVLDPPPKSEGPLTATVRTV